jgi:hypothetical protein
MVENAASRQIAPVIERQLKTEVDRAMVSLQSDITFLGQIADAGSYMRGRGRPGFDKLVELQRNAATESMRIRAKSMLATIGKDYEQYVSGPSGEDDGRLLTNYLTAHAEELKRFGESEKRAHLIPILIKEIRTSDDLHEVTTAFLALRKLTNQHFQVFDMDAVNNWCAEHTSQCK